jgi:hypothetical protein
LSTLLCGITTSSGKIYGSPSWLFFATLGAIFGFLYGFISSIILLMMQKKLVNSN